MVALDLAVSSPRQDEFPGSLIPLPTSPIKTQVVTTTTHDSHCLTLTLPQLNGSFAHTPEGK